MYQHKKAEENELLKPLAPAIKPPKTPKTPAMEKPKAQGWAATTLKGTPLNYNKPQYQYTAPVNQQRVLYPAPEADDRLFRPALLGETQVPTAPPRAEPFNDMYYTQLFQHAAAEHNVPHHPAASYPNTPYGLAGISGILHGDATSTVGTFKSDDDRRKFVNASATITPPSIIDGGSGFNPIMVERARAELPRLYTQMMRAHGPIKMYERNRMYEGHRGYTQLTPMYNAPVTATVTVKSEPAALATAIHEGTHLKERPLTSEMYNRFDAQHIANLPQDRAKVRPSLFIYELAPSLGDRLIDAELTARAQNINDQYGVYPLNKITTPYGNTLGGYVLKHPFSEFGTSYDAALRAAREHGYFGDAYPYASDGTRLHTTTLAKLLFENPQYLKNLLNADATIVPPPLAKAYAIARGEISPEEQMQWQLPINSQHGAFLPDIESPTRNVKSYEGDTRVREQLLPDEATAYINRHRAQQEAPRRAAYLRARAAEEQRLQLTPEQRDKRVNDTLREMGLSPLTPSK